MSLLDKIKQGLQKTKTNVAESLNNLFAGFRKIDDDLLDELLEILLISDVSYETAQAIIKRLKEEAKHDKIETGDALKLKLCDIITDIMEGDNDLKLNTKPSVILVVGVNGVGKTTTIGKLSNFLKLQGKKVIIAAADTFRAAAIEQVEIWAERASIDLIKHNDGSDPAAVVFDSIKAAKARGIDVVICDTAGRLHNKKNLMGELSKITRVIERELPDADIEILLVLDATTGQNAIVQAKDFKEVANITGVVLTKLDGTAKGGVTISVKEVTGVPVKLIGVGEKIDDIQPFVPALFAKELLDL